MRISIFDQANMNVVIHENKNAIKPVRKTASTLEALFKLVSDRAVKNRLNKCTDHGEGHWFLLSYNDACFKAGNKGKSFKLVQDKVKAGGKMKHVVLFMNSSHSKAIVSLQVGTKIAEVDCEINQYFSNKTPVWDVRTDNEKVGVNEIKLGNSLADKIDTLEAALARIADLEKENADKDNQIEELTRQRDEANDRAHNSNRLRAFHCAKKFEVQDENYIMKRIMKQHGLSIADDVQEELENFDIEQLEVINETEVKNEVKEETPVETAELTPYEKLELEIQTLEEKRVAAQTPEEGALLAGLIKQKKIRLCSTSRYNW